MKFTRNNDSNTFLMRACELSMRIQWIRQPQNKATQSKSNQMAAETVHSSFRQEERDHLKFNGTVRTCLPCIICIRNDYIVNLECYSHA